MTERININRLAASPEKQPERLFDPQRDITLNDREYLSKNLPFAQRSGCLAAYVNHLHVLGQKEVFSSQVEIDKLQNLRQNAQNANRLPFILDLAEHEANLYRAQIIAEVPKNDLTQFNAALERYDRSSRSYLRLAAAFGVLGNAPRLSTEHRREIIEKWRSDVDTARSMPELAKWDDLASIAASARVIGLELPVNSDVWNYFHKKLSDFRDNHWPLKFAQIAADMAILSANSVTIPPGGGLKLEWHDGAEETESTPPVTKKF